jgi:hypothetical protein
MATVVLRVVPVVELILPTVTTLTVIVHVRRDGMEQYRCVLNRGVYMGKFDCINKIVSYFHTNLMSFSCIQCYRHNRMIPWNPDM